MVPIAGQSATQDRAFVFTLPVGTFIDIDAGDTLAYRATLASGTPLPAWLTFDASTRRFGGTPANADVGAIVIRITATDIAGASAHDDFTLTVGNVNDAPTLAAPIAAQSATQDRAFVFVLPADSFSDIDAGDTLVYDARLASGAALPAWLSFDATTRTFSGAPANADVGAIIVRVTATDTAGASAHGGFMLAVANVNDAPVVAAPIADQQAVQGVAFAFVVPAGTFSDVDAGDMLRLGARQADGSALPQWLRFDDRTQAFAGTPPAGVTGRIAVQLIATDPSGAAARTVFAIDVSAPLTVAGPALPVAPPPPPTATVVAPAPAASAAPAPPAPAPSAVAVETSAALPLLAGADELPPMPGIERSFETPRRDAGTAATAVMHLASRADAVLADAVVPQFAELSLGQLTQLLRSDDLLRRLDEAQRQTLGRAEDHQSAIASSIALTGGMSIGYAMWLVRGGVLASSMLSALPAWQTVDPLPVLAAADKGRRRDGRSTPDDPEVERLFDARPTKPRHAAVPVPPPRLEAAAAPAPADVALSPESRS